MGDSGGRGGYIDRVREGKESRTAIPVPPCPCRSPTVPPRTPVLVEVPLHYGPPYLPVLPGIQWTDRGGPREGGPVVGWVTGVGTGRGVLPGCTLR